MNSILISLVSTLIFFEIKKTVSIETVKDKLNALSLWLIINVGVYIGFGILCYFFNLII